MSKALVVTSDISRRLQTKNFEAGSTIAFDIPRDTVFKHLQVRLSGALAYTYASGTPLADDTASMNRLINYIDVVENGSKTIKNVTPWMMHIQQFMATAIFGVRRSSAGATASVYPSVDAGFTFGTTGQLTSIVDSILISFENVMSGKGRMTTLWDTRGLASAELKISTAQFSNLLASGNTAPVVFGASTLQISIETIETQNVPQNVYFSTWKQSTKNTAFTAQVSDYLIDISRGNFLQGLMFECRDGASGSAATNTGKQLTNTLVNDLKLVINGTSYIQNTTFQTLQEKNINRYGINNPYVSNKSVLDGYAYMDLLTPNAGEKFGAINTAQNVQAPLVDQVQLAVSTSSTSDYTGTANLKIMTNEILQPVGN